MSRDETAPSDRGGSPKRKPGADGIAVRLADGGDWLFPRVTYRAGSSQLTHPGLDRWLDRFHEAIVFGEQVDLIDVMAVARLLLRENYDLTDREISELLCVAPGAEAAELGHAVFRAVFGTQDEPRSYSRWVRASLRANGLADLNLTADDLNDVLAVLAATHRTVAASDFIDACREANLRDSLEHLV